MIVNEAKTTAQIKQAAQSIKTKRPAYSDIIDFYEQIFTAQEDAKEEIQLQPLELDPETLTIKLKDHFPLVSVSDFRIDRDAATTLLVRLCDVTADAKSEMAATAQVMSGFLQSERVEMTSLFAALLGGDDDVLAAAADRMGVDKEALAFLVYSAAKPSLSACVAQLVEHLKDVAWEKGYCPVCGSHPGLALLGIDGDRWLCCGFCWHKWATSRIFCPFCENTDNQTLHYFFSEAEKSYRVDVCDKCNRYIKTVDTRQADHPIYAPLEQVSTLHLDMLAREKGLERTT